MYFPNNRKSVENVVMFVGTVIAASPQVGNAALISTKR
jgi:hypothetical protein